MSARTHTQRCPSRTSAPSLSPPPPDVLICSCAHPHPPHTHPPRSALSAPSHTPAPSHTLADHPPQGSHELHASTSAVHTSSAPAARTPPCPLVHPTRRVACHRRSPRALIARARTPPHLRPPAPTVPCPAAAHLPFLPCPPRIHRPHPLVSPPKF